MANLEIGGQGFVGVAFEAVLGTFVAPSKFIPIRSESLRVNEDKFYRMNLRATADRQKGAQGNTFVEGDIEFEVTSDNLLYFLYAARVNIAKVGTDPFTYTFTPVHLAKPSTGAGAEVRKTLSILITRGGEGFGYAGCSVTGLSFSFDNEILVCTASVMGLTQTMQSIPTPTFDDSSAYGPEENTIEIPSGNPSAVSNATVTIDEGGEARHRIDGSRFPLGVRWGEREVTFSSEQDFEDMTQYNAFLNHAIQTLLLLASRDADDDQVKVTVKGAIADSNETQLGSIGDLVASSVEYHGTHEADGIYEIEVKTTEDIS